MCLIFSLFDITSAREVPFGIPQHVHYAMFTLLHSSMNQQLFKKYICNQSSHYENTRYHVPQLSSETKVSIALLYQLFSTRYTAVQIKNCFKSTSVIKVTTMNNIDDFHYAKEAIKCNQQINALHCQ